MAITPEQAGEKNDAHIQTEVERLEEIIDGQLSNRWHSGASMVELPAPETDSDWSDEILAVLSTRYVDAGWMIERQHEPTARWIFKRAR